MTLISRLELARRIDHTLLKPDATPAQIDKLCAEAREFHCAAVCVNGAFVAQAKSALQGSGVKTCGVLGFPLGAMSTHAKIVETTILIADGAEELDMVLAIGMLKASLDSEVEVEIASIVRLARATPVKVILETCLLSDEEKVRACEIAIAAGAKFVKTSTGFSSGGATLDDVRLLRRTVGSRALVKASGGIRDTATALAMLDAGADRLGLSSTAAVLGGLPA